MKNPIAIVSRHGIEDLSIQIGTEEWFSWLESQSSFRYECVEGSFTARRYNNYWNAYRKRFGKLRQEYLGKSSDLTLERLVQVARLMETEDITYWRLRNDRAKVKGKGYREKSSITMNPQSNGYRESDSITTPQKTSLTVTRESQFQDAVALLEDSLTLFSDEVDVIKQNIRRALHLLRG